MKKTAFLNVFGLIAIVLALVIVTSVYTAATGNEICSRSETSGKFSHLKETEKTFSIKINRGELSPFKQVPGTEELRFAADCTPVPVATINVSGTWGGKMFLLGSVKSAFIMELVQASDDTLSGTITFFPGMERMLIIGNVSGTTITFNQTNGDYLATLVASDTSLQKFEGTGRDPAGADFDLMVFK